jgi:hypothetical protein
MFHAALPPSPFPSRAVHPSPPNAPDLTDRVPGRWPSRTRCMPRAMQAYFRRRRLHHRTELGYPHGHAERWVEILEDKRAHLIKSQLY